MEKDRSFKVMSIAALLVGVVGISLGFAAFNTSLTINGEATVTPTDSTFAGRVYFAATGATADSAEPGEVTYTGTNCSGKTNTTGTSLTVTCNFSGTTAQNVTGTLEATILNDSPFTANVTSVETTFDPVCTSLTGNEKTACEAMSMTCDLTTGATIASGATKKVTCTVTYPGETYPVDDEFSMTFATVTYGFQSAA